MYYYLKRSAIQLVITSFLVVLLSSCCKENNCSDVDEPPYWEHFIAHAGGAIDGDLYTNCLEALDLSYSKGCKLFELDLVLTTDGKIVAQHDPPGITEAEFMARPILGKYTPLNMEAINRWFQNHPDAILVTDKISDPQMIFDQFSFRNRVIMELFTWDAVDKAIELGIKPMVSENLIFGKSEKAIQMGIPPLPPIKTSDIEQILEDKKIEYICMSRVYGISGNEEFLRRWKNKGIKNYVFHLELPVPISGISAEEYVWNYEMDFCYGMYANDLDLLVTLLNENLSLSKK
jgi:hypothetical protein